MDQMMEARRQMGKVIGTWCETPSASPMSVNSGLAQARIPGPFWRSDLDQDSARGGVQMFTSKPARLSLGAHEHAGCTFNLVTDVVSTSRCSPVNCLCSSRQMVWEEHWYSRLTFELNSDTMLTDTDRDRHCMSLSARSLCRGFAYRSSTERSSD